MKHYIYIILIYLSLGHALYAQKTLNFAELSVFEDSMKLTAPIILKGNNDNLKYEASEKLYTFLTEALEFENSFNYAFDSLKTISILKSPDNYFRIFTWNLQKQDGSYDYFGLIQVNPKKTKGDNIIKLNNGHIKSSLSMSDVLMPEEWYGAHYYNIIQKKGKDRVYYTLLGWDGNNTITTRKIIDVLVFDAHGQPEFGAPIFHTHEELKTRFIMEYASYVSASLKYEKHFLYQGKNKKWMLVFDRVSPLSPHLVGHYQYYVPESDTYDAFIFEDGIWFLYEDVDARNPKTDKKAIKKKMKALEKNKSEQKK